MQSLLAEMIVAIETEPLPAFCYTGIMPGGVVSLDYCQECDDTCGMAWVRLASIREEVEDDTPSRCSTTFSVNIEMGMVRCHATSDEEGNPMPVEYQFAKAEAQMDEQAVMRRVLLCSETAQGYDKLLGAYLPIGPEGGCVGGAWTAQYSVM